MYGGTAFAEVVYAGRAETVEATVELPSFRCGSVVEAGNTGTLSITPHADTLVGDMMVIQAAIGSHSPKVSSWREIISPLTNYKAFWKIAEAADLGTAVSITGGSTGYSGGAMLLSFANAGSIGDVAITGTNTSGTVDTTETNEVVAELWASTQMVTGDPITDPTGTTAVYTTGATSYYHGKVTLQPMSTAGTTVSRTATGAAASFAIALRTSAFVPPTKNDYRTSALADSPIGYWEFEDADGATTFVNSVTDGTALVERGAVEQSVAVGIFPESTGSVHGFASTDYLDWPDQPLLSGAHSIECVFSLSSLSSLNGIGLFGSRGPTDYSTSCWVNSSGNLIIDVGDGSSTWLLSVSVAAGLTTNTWYHLVLVVSTTGVTVYLNGNQIYSAGYGATYTPMLLSANHRLRVGQLGPLYAANWPGIPATIDEFAVYPSVLTGEQVVSRFQSSGVPAPVNDNPDTAVSIDDGGTVTTDTSGATTDPLAPTEGGTESAWYSVTATNDDALLVDATESDYDTLVAVYEGTADTTMQDYNLTLVASGEGKVSFKPQPGKTYTIQVGSKTSGTGGTQKVKQKKSTFLGRWGIPL